MIQAAVCMAALFLLVVPTVRGNTPEIGRIQEKFVAPCCWLEKVAVHDSRVAQDMRAEIASLVAAGKTEEEITGYYVARYGERILGEPRGTKWIVLTAMPLLALVIPALCLCRYLARWKAAAPQERGSEPLPDLPDADLQA